MFVSSRVLDRRNHRAIDFGVSAEELLAVGLPKERPMFVHRPSEVKPDDPSKAVAVAARREGALDRRIKQQGVKEDPEQNRAEDPRERSGISSRPTRLC